MITQRPSHQQRRSKSSSGGSWRYCSTSQIALFMLGCGASVVTLATVAVTHQPDMKSLEQENPIQQSLKYWVSASSSSSQEKPATTSQDQAKQQERRSLSEIYPYEEAVPNPDPPADGHDTFSACMLVMDDNHRLTEWLAYHYHVLPLRYIVLTMDPRSQTSPSSILNAWRRRGVYVEEWVDRDFWKPELKLVPIPENATLQVKRDRHRGRQKYFYRKCLIHMQRHNRTWVALHDTDEYLVYNHAGGERFAAWEAKQLQLHLQSKIHGHLQRVQPSVVPPPSTAEEGAMIQYIRREQAAGLEFYQSPCIGIPRMQFGSVESTFDQTAKDVPTDWLQQQNNPEQLPRKLDTLRWRKHAPRNDFVKNALGKVIIDVSRVDVTKSPQFMSLHRPIKTICKAPWHNDWESGLRLNHYLGSWPSYRIRDDARRGFERSREQWEFKSQNNADYDDDNIRPWLSGFVEAHGNEEASEWLAGAGLPEGYDDTDRNYNAAEDANWHLLPDKMKEIISQNETVANDGKKVAFDAFVREKYYQDAQYRALMDEHLQRHEQELLQELQHLNEQNGSP